MAILKRCSREGCVNLYVKNKGNQKYCCTHCRSLATESCWSKRKRVNKAIRDNVRTCQYETHNDLLKGEPSKCGLPVREGNRFLCSYHYKLAGSEILPESMLNLRYSR